MPGGNGTGPSEYGPFTGRGLGYCAGYHTPGFMKGAAHGRGLAFRRGSGRGHGRGYRHVPYQVPVYNPINNITDISKEDKVDFLKETARTLEDELNQVKEQLNKLEDKNDN